LPLLFRYSARAVALGETLTALPSVDGLFYNPASLAGTGADQFVVHHQDTFTGQNNAFTVLLDFGLAGAFGLTYVLVDQGEEEVGTGPVPTGTLNIRHHVLVASYATQVVKSLRAGLSYKLYNFGLTCVGFCPDGETSSTTHLLDVGVQYQPGALRQLALGISVMHLGFPLQVLNAEQADVTPARVRVGAAYEVGHHLQRDTSVEVTVTTELTDRLREPGNPILSAGVEVSFDRVVYLRAGYSQAGQGIATGGAGIGIGIRFQRYTVGVAKSFNRTDVQTEGEPFHISFGIVF
jgi:hypothetical protein